MLSNKLAIVFKVPYLIRAGLSQTGNRSLGWLLSSTATEKVDTVKTERLHGETSLDLIPALVPGDFLAAKLDSDSH